MVLKPIVLGGGHEVAFGSFSGLFQYVQAHAPDKKSALLISMPILIYVKQSATSGTPFYRQLIFQNSIKNNLIIYVLGLPTMPILKFCLILPMR